MNRADLEPIILDALKSLGGSSSLVDVAKYIWKNYESQLQASGDFFYIWQYDMRRAAESLRNKGQLHPINKRTRLWEIV